ncbi:5'-nucleotidase [Holothuria leucospilota]|uniref:5'-nucleotidase n=1 Tax=Holothuria leucospilota TaxID=206669 RepID=A0A9Q0YP99_HOLLE|nr:5'-nucleotidase [Holothuria leucospilota]
MDNDNKQANLTLPLFILITQQTIRTLLGRVLLCSFVCVQVCQLVTSLDLVLLHTNDVHARFEQFDKDGNECTQEKAAADECYGGVARRATKIKEIREEYHGNTLLLDGGDQFQGSQWFYHYEGAATAYFMNQLGYDAMALGNHEFDTGVGTLVSFLNKVTFPVLSCNIDARDEPGLQGLFTKSTVVKVAGERIGIVGYTYSRTPLISNSGNVIFEKEIDAIQREVNKLTSSGIDKIIAIGNSGYDMEVKIAKETRGIDIIAGGNSFKFLYSGNPPTDDVVTGPYPTVIYPSDDRRSGEKVLLVQDATFGKYLGYLKVTFDDEGRVTEYRGNPIVLDASVEQDPEILAQVAEWGEAVRASSSTVVGETYVQLDGERDSCRVQECNLGNLIADAMLDSHLTAQGEEGWSDVSIAILNSGAIRSSIGQGTIRTGDVTTALPFMDTFDMVELNGRHLMEALERSVESIDAVRLPGYFLQVSGIRVHFDLDNDPGRRVVSVEVLCSDCQIPKYKELQMGKLYKVVMTSYLARGGDGYKMIIDNKRNQKTGRLDSTVVSDYIKKQTPIIQGVEDRIIISGEIPISNGYSLCGSLSLAFFAAIWSSRFASYL